MFAKVLDIAIIAVSITAIIVVINFWRDKA